LVAKDAVERPTGDELVQDIVPPALSEGQFVRPGSHEGVGYIVCTYRAFEPLRVAGILGKTATTVLTVFRAVIYQFRARVEHAEQYTIGEALVDFDLYRMIVTPTDGKRSIGNRLVLREETECLGHVTSEAGVGQSDSSIFGDLRIDICLQDPCTERQNLGIVDVVQYAEI